MTNSIQGIEIGFYYHYKHDNEKDVNNYSCEVIGVAMHTKDRSFGVLVSTTLSKYFLKRLKLLHPTYRHVQGNN